jgi:two-component system, response regulator
VTTPAILLVEDNASDEELALRALRRSNVGGTVTVVRDGAAALDYLFGRGIHADRDPDDLPRVVLLDLNLPKIGGLDVLRAIRGDERTRLVPVVILTSSNEDRDITGCYAAGANSYIVKAIDFILFAESVKQLGEYWTVLNQSPPRRG